MRKILGILNIVAGAISILALHIFLYGGMDRIIRYSMYSDHTFIISVILWLLIAGESMTVGIIVLKGKPWILAAVNFILAVSVWFGLFIGLTLNVYGI